MNVCLVLVITVADVWTRTIVSTVCVPQELEEAFVNKLSILVWSLLQSMDLRCYEILECVVHMAPVNHCLQETTTASVTEITLETTVI